MKNREGKEGWMDGQREREYRWGECKEEREEKKEKGRARGKGQTENLDHKQPTWRQR